MHAIMIIALAVGVPGAGAGGGVPACAGARTFMERSICLDPAIAAHDAAMTELYRHSLRRGGPPVRDAQRRWLGSAIACRDRSCLTARYDERTSELLEGDGRPGRVERYSLHRPGTEGSLLILRRSGWITYAARETAVGRRGAADGDVDAATIGGTVRIVGALARDERPGGCVALLRINRNGSISMATRHCFDGSGADLNELFHPVPTSISR